MSTIVKITSENLDEVLSSSIESTIIVNCFAPWCGPCKALAPLFKRFSTENVDEFVKFYEVDIDECDTFVHKFDIKSVPTIVVLKNNVCVSRLCGAQTYDTLKNFIASLC